MLYYFTEIVGFVFSVQNKSDFFLTEIPVTSIKKKSQQAWPPSWLPNVRIPLELAWSNKVIPKLLCGSQG